MEPDHEEKPRIHRKSGTRDPAVQPQEEAHLLQGLRLLLERPEAGGETWFG